MKDGGAIRVLRLVLIAGRIDSAAAWAIVRVRAPLAPLIVLPRAAPDRDSGAIILDRRLVSCGT